MYSLFYADELSEFLCAIVVRTQNCVQRYTKKLRYANYFCILHEISMKLQKTNTKKIEKTATRVAVFNLCEVSHIFNFSRRVWKIISVLASSLPYGHLHGLQHVGFGCLYDNSNLRNSDLRVVAH